MPKRSMSLSRSQSDVATPKRKKSRGSRSVCSPALSTASGRLTSLIDQFKDKNRQSFALSPLNSKSILTDNTDIEEPRRKSWWKKLDENTQAVMEMLEKDKATDPNILIEDLIDIEVLSQEKKNFTLDLPESSDNESINSIVLPQRKLFNRKENQPPKNFEQIMGNRESLAKIHKANTTNIEEAVNAGTRQLFQNVKRPKLTFPTALLQLSPNKTAADKTKENVVVEPKVRNIFGNRPNNKRKNMYAEFIVSESEDEIPDIQPKVFGFHKKIESRRISSISKGKDTSPTSSITTDIEMDDWKHLPSSTMVDNQLEDMVVGHTPVKRTRLSKLSEAKESEAGTNTLQTNTTGDKTKQSNKSTTSKNKSKSSPEIKDKTLENSRTTRSMAKNTSIRELHNTSRKQATKTNKSQNKTNKEIELDDSLSTPKENNKQTTSNKSLKENLSRTRNDTKATENGNEMESDENVVQAINNETKVIRKSSIKNKSNNITNKSINEEDVEINAKESTNGEKIQNKSNKTGSDNVNTNEENDDDDQNFTLQYENDIDKDEAVVNMSVLEKKCQKDDTNKARSNNSLNKLQKQDITTSVKPVESQQDEQNTEDDDVDGMQENNHDAEIELNLESKHNNSNQIENELNKNDEESEGNQDNINKSNNEVNISQEIEDEHKVEDVANASGVGEDENYISNNDNASEAGVEEANASEEDEEEANASEEDEIEANAGEEDEEEANASEEDEEEANASEEDEGEANASEENEEEANASDEDEGNKSQEVEVDVNDSQETDVKQSEKIEGERNESHVTENDHASDEENNEEIEEDEEEIANETQRNESHVTENDHASDEENNEEIEEDEEEIANETQEVANESDVENEADVSESKEVEHDQEMDESDEADKAIATDVETSEDDNDEMEVDDEQEPFEDVEETEENPVEQNEIEPSDEVIEESPDVTHDTTGRNRKKDLNKSPEAILNNRTNQMDSFTANGRNTSARKTKSMIKNLNIRPSLAPPRDSIGFSDGTTNSSAEGSGWDSHRTTRKTLRQTFGKDFTPRKSLRALVMEKSAKRHTAHIDLHSETVKFPQANSTEFPENSTQDVEELAESDHEVSRRTRQTTLETYLQKIKQQNINLKLQMEESVRNSLKGPARDPLSLFKVPNKPAPRRAKPTQNKPKPKKQIRSIIPIDELPSEVIADMKYKPPKRFQPTNASWITKRLYKFLENKLEARYDYKARLRAEKLVETIYYFAKDLRRHNVAPVDAVDVLKHELARLDIVHTHFEFYEFFHEFMPREIRVKVVPDIVNNIPLPRHGVFSDIIRGTQG